MSSLLVKLIGFPATLIHGDTLVLDRWLWLTKQLPPILNGSRRILDVGCGTGAFSIGFARRGYRSLGLSWDKRNQLVASERASICQAPLARFEVQDVRRLDERPDLRSEFDVVVCCENIEHILDDKKLMIDMAGCLKSGGRLLLTSPNVNYKPITRNDNGPFSKLEDGGHVRRGYTAERLRDLCAAARLSVVEIDYCSGISSQKITALFRVGCGIHTLLGWAVILPLRLFPPRVDPWLSKVLNWPDFSITLVAVKE